LGLADKKMLERRKHKRFQVQDDAVAVLRPSVDKRGPIIDISMGGLAFSYVTSKDSSNRSSRLDILLPDLSFYLAHMPIRTVSDFKVTSESPFRSIESRRRSVQFGKMTQEQMSQLERFIQNHTRRWDN
jgi:hypothetical protein